ncbi:DnaD domain protein (plasmid) [Rossellomorea sp. AcN35-11]|nr:DnaD domain protein [Rossellomorea aquimaris]WJV32221.1 DnaD domain protein [Rossellomorea sp. AcN35-11]
MFLKEDVYVVRSDSLMGDIDQKVLTYLYQPLIGVECVGLYNTFWNELDHYKLQGDKRSIIHLTKLLRVSIEGLEDCLKKIESLGLVRTYVKKENNVQYFVFELYPPLSPKSFMENEIYSYFLQSELSTDEIKGIMSLFKKKRINKTNYTELTHSFGDVFGSFHPDDLTVNRNDAIIGDRVEKRQGMVKGLFNIDKFLSKMRGSSVLVPEEYFTEEILESILRIAFVYNFDESEMIGIVADSYDDVRGFVLEDLRSCAVDYYLLKSGSKKRKIIEKQNLNTVPEEGLSEIEKNYLNITPYDALKYYFSDGEPPWVDIKVIEEVLMQIKLAPGVLNVLIDFVMINNNHQFKRGLITKIAAEWKRAGVETVHQALERAKQDYQRMKKFKDKEEEERKREKGEDKPEWVQEEVNQTLTEEEVEEQKARMERINRMLDEE